MRIHSKRLKQEVRPRGGEQRWVRKNVQPGTPIRHPCKEKAKRREAGGVELDKKKKKKKKKTGGACRPEGGTKILEPQLAMEGG